MQKPTVSRMQHLRLLDVTPNDRSDNLRLQIVPFQGSQYDYFTLSHCWGKKGAFEIDNCEH